MRWKDWEDARVWQLHGKVETSALAVRLKRSRNAINRRRGRLAKLLPAYAKGTELEIRVFKKIKPNWQEART